jgi:DNA-directed RNA polymerase subunit RPC12/RpoP
MNEYKYACYRCGSRVSDIREKIMIVDNTQYYICPECEQDVLMMLNEKKKLLRQQHEEEGTYSMIEEMKFNTTNTGLHEDVIPEPDRKDDDFGTNTVKFTPGDDIGLAE